MLTIILTAVLPVYFLIICFKLREYRAEERTLKATKPLSKIISLSPLAGIVIFAVLFAFVLKGRFAERATHAFLVFALWLYAPRFYQYILSYYKKKAIIAASVTGMGVRRRWRFCLRLWTDMSDSYIHI